MKFEECRSYSDMAKFLGYSYYNGNTKKKILKYAEEQGFNVEEIILSNNTKSICYCLNGCGKEIKPGNKFCSNSCAASYNNKKRTLSLETKDKISKSLRIYNKISLDPVHTFNAVYRTCIICGKEFEVKRNSITNRLSNSTTCSPECHQELLKIRGELNYEKAVSEGRFQGWKTRNITSYAEQFWEEVLTNNKINFIREYVVEIDKTHRYFLDFLIEINGVKIDLEIDGKQHKYQDRAESDKRRDILLNEKGFLVYRIPWNSINTESGKLSMTYKINSFVDFYKSFKE